VRTAQVSSSAAGAAFRNGARVCPRGSPAAGRTLLRLTLRAQPRSGKLEGPSEPPYDQHVRYRRGYCGTWGRVAVALPAAAAVGWVVEGCI
jgi:hypothetical protein